jgi:hypothetical protein
VSLSIEKKTSLHLPSLYQAEFASFLEMTRTKTPATRPTVSKPNETDADDGKSINLTRCDAADDEATVKVKELVHRYMKDILFSCKLQRLTEDETSQFPNPIQRFVQSSESDSSFATSSLSQACRFISSQAAVPPEQTLMTSTARRVSAIGVASRSIEMGITYVLPLTSTARGSLHYSSGCHRSVYLNSRG